MLLFTYAEHMKHNTTLQVLLESGCLTDFYSLNKIMGCPRQFIFKKNNHFSLFFHLQNEEVSKIDFLESIVMFHTFGQVLPSTLPFISISDHIVVQNKVNLFRKSVTHSAQYLNCELEISFFGLHFSRHLRKQRQNTRYGS